MYEYENVQKYSKVQETRQELINSSEKFLIADTQTKIAKEQLDDLKKKKQDTLNSSEYKQALDEKNQAQQALNENKQQQKQTKNEIKNLKNKIDEIEDQIDDLQDQKKDIQKKIKKLKKENTYEAQQEIKKLEKKSKEIDKNIENNKKQLENNKEKLRRKESHYKALKIQEKEIEEKKEKADKNFEKQQEKIEKIDKQIEKAEENYEKMKENEEKVLDELAEKYPETFKDKVEAYKDAIHDAEMDIIRREQAEREAKKQEEIKKEKEEQLKKNEEEIEQYGTDEDGYSLADFYDKKGAEECETKECTQAYLDQAKADLEAKKIEDLENKLKNVKSPEEQRKLAEKLKKLKQEQEAKEQKDLFDFLFDALSDPNYGNILWDSPTAGPTIGGRLDTLIADHMQPKYKHAYFGEFPGNLSKLDWMVKSMDRPKIDIEYVEQVRNNVKRYYPVKYNYGDISITFWDNVEHRTIKTIHEYFTGKIWQQYEVDGPGFILLRDSAIIPSLIVWDLSIDGEDNIKYIFENVSLSSFDFDANEDETDEGVHTIQAVFKFERYNIITTKDPPRSLGFKAVFWEHFEKNNDSLNWNERRMTE